MTRESECLIRDVQLLEFCCKETGMTKADVIRQGIKPVYEGLKE